MFKSDPKPERTGPKPKKPLKRTGIKKYTPEQWTKEQYNDFLEKQKAKSKRTRSKRKKKKIYDTTAWTWCARYIKILHANNDGYITCKTSGIEMKLGDKRMHAGHCIKVYDANSTNYSVAFDVRNIMPQTSQENVYYGGRSEIMRDKIDEYWGEGTYESLKIKAKKAVFYTKSDLKEFSDKFRKMAYSLLEERGFKKWW